MSILSYLNENYPIRRTEAEKEAFRAYVTAGYGARVEGTSDGKNKNLVIGDPTRARTVCVAHYDTPARALFPNLMLPRNPVLFYAYQFLIVGVLLAVSLAVGLVAQILTQRTEAYAIGFLLTYYLGFYLMFFAFSNKHNANDNTSGVATVLTLAEECKDADVAFILFDREEAGKKGSKAYFKDHRAEMKNRTVLNFDCVGNGEHILFIVPKVLEGGEEMEGLRRAMQAEGGYTPYFFPAKGSTCNSDQKSFPHGVACVACRRTRRGIFYTPAIHTEKDTVAKDANVRYLADGVGLWLRGQSKG